ncbi:alpha/beta hydrolase [Prolixibacteraceae bacterium JC049]|nr:alpha/beta hydrolase [Prolixibacteraceae bacterium JC049]
MNKMRKRDFVKLFVWVSILLVSCNNSDDDLKEKKQSNTIEFSKAPVSLGGVDLKYAENIAYDVYPETVFDILLPQVERPTALVVFIHGGGFTSGDKNFIYKEQLINDVKELLQNNIAVATLNYRLLTENEEEGVLKCLNDSKRALQFIRYKADELNVDKENILLYGVSAGAGTSLWLATNDDMRNPESTDFVSRESTRVKGIALKEMQCSYDIERRWIEDVFEDYNLQWGEFLVENKETLFRFYGVDSEEEYESAQIDEYRKKIDMLMLLSSDDPEVWASNTQTIVSEPVNTAIAYHHAFHVRELKEYADAVGVMNVCYYGKDPIIYSDSSNESYVDFFIRKANE